MLNGGDGAILELYEQGKQQPLTEILPEAGERKSKRDDSTSRGTFINPTKSTSHFSPHQIFLPKDYANPE